MSLIISGRSVRHFDSLAADRASANNEVVSEQCSAAVQFSSTPIRHKS
jgi:hypothetical protein